jgi:hypothetical protein
VHVLAELAARVRDANPDALVISEMGSPDFRPVTEWGHDAMWLDSLHHALHVALTGERDGYYADFDGSMAQIAAELRRPEGAKIVAAAQNHEVPDPQDVESFELSKLTAREPEPLYVELLRLRRELPRELEVSFDEQARTLELRRGRATLRADFRGETVELDG